MFNYIIQFDKLSRLMKYTVKQLQADFPDDDACLEWLVAYLYPNGMNSALNAIQLPNTTEYLVGVHIVARNAAIIYIRLLILYFIGHAHLLPIGFTLFT